MTVSIPSAAGVPGISGPPDWFSGGAGQSFQLDDVRWRGAVKRTFGSGAAGSNFFRATQATVGADKFIYLTFRAAFVQELSDQFDTVYLGLRKHADPTAMVIRIQAHDASFTPKGPPSAAAPAAPFSVQVSTLAGGVWGPVATPAWIDPLTTVSRMWLQSSADIGTDPNNRWAIQLRIPIKAAGGITNSTGPELGTDFDMWYLLHGSAAGNPVILADYRLSGSTTEGNLILGTYPTPDTIWDEFLLTSAAATSGGVAIYWGDVLVQNVAYGTGTTIDNHQNNSFIARPRNYSSAVIPAGGINATFRIANWGSVGGDPNQPDFNTGVWAYVPGNSELVPVISNSIVPVLTPPNNPPATSPIQLDTVMNLPPGSSKHQCVLVTMSGANLNFLNDAIYQNMNYDTASVLEREAEISIVGLKPFSPQPRDVYLAIEKVNLLRNTPGANEGQFLSTRMNQLIQFGGALAEKLIKASSRLSDVGDSGSAARLKALLDALRNALGGPNAAPVSGRLISELSDWLPPAKQDENAAKRLAPVFEKLADWLNAPSQSADAKLTAFIAALNQWLAGSANDPISARSLPGVLVALQGYLSEQFHGAGQLGAAVEKLIGWLRAQRPAAQLAAVLETLRQALATYSSVNNQLKAGVATFADGTARWLRGSERLDTLVDALSDAGLTEEEVDQLFPTFRVHVYNDTGERVTQGGEQRPVLRVQSSFGLYVYHEGGLEGWQTSIQGAQRIADNLYLLAVPNNGSAKITVRVQAVENEGERLPEDPIQKRHAPPKEHEGCLTWILRCLHLK